MQKIRVAAESGHSLDVWVDGPSGGTPVVVHHGTPTSGLPYRPFVEEATRRGLRWVSYSRPGYGDEQRGRTRRGENDNPAPPGRKRTEAHVLAGGALPYRTTVSEQHLLDLEREAFLKLCGEPKTLERIQHTLKTGKPLRN